MDVARRRLDELAGSGRKLLIYYWVDDAFSLLAIFGNQPDFGSSVSYVCGDTLLGAISSAVLAHLGRRTLPLRRKGQTASLTDVQRIVRELNPISISADGLGRAFVVSPGLARLAASRGGLVVPVAVRASRSLSLGWCGLARVPLPTARISVALGEPIDVRHYRTELLRDVLDCRLRQAHAEAWQRIS